MARRKFVLRVVLVLMVLGAVVRMASPSQSVTPSRPGALAPVVLGHSEIARASGRMAFCCLWHEPRRPYAVAVPVALMLASMAAIAFIQIRRSRSASQPPRD